MKGYNIERLEYHSFSASLSTTAGMDTAQSEMSLIKKLCDGDETTFGMLVNTHHNNLMGVAMSYVSNREMAEEIVQETWLGVLRGIHRFKGRCSLKTWIYRILTNRAITKRHQESRMVRYPLGDETVLEENEAKDPSLGIQRPNHRMVSSRIHFPKPWSLALEELILAREACHHANQVIDTLPPNQRTVIKLRDLEGWTAQEVCERLDLSPENQRVLLYRARTKVRRALEAYFEGGG